MPACKERCTGWCAHNLRVRIVQDCSGGCERVDVRGRHRCSWIVRRDVTNTDIIGKNDKNVWLRVRGRWQCCCCGRFARYIGVSSSNVVVSAVRTSFAGRSAQVLSVLARHFGARRVPISVSELDITILTRCAGARCSGARANTFIASNARVMALAHRVFVETLCSVRAIRT